MKDDVNGNDDVRTGTCLCGTVRFRTRGALRGVIYCHCSQCRRQTGHFVAATNVADERIDIEGGEAITWYAASDEARRGFCGRCGSLLFWKHSDLDSVSVMAGAFDTPTGLSAECHIFVADKGDYYTIDDGLPQHARSTDSIVVARD
jgi:hypothetical protein